MANNNNFKLTLDTLAPQNGSILVDGLNTVVTTNSNKKLVINRSDASFMKIWFDTNAQGTKSGDAYDHAVWATAATSADTQFESNGTFYYHMILMDSVGNESEVLNSKAVRYDITKPTVTSVEIKNIETGNTHITKSYTGNRITFNFNDEHIGSTGVSRAEITGPFVDGTTKRVDIGSNQTSGYLNFEFEHTQGSKTLRVKVQDAAGNWSDEVSTTILVDTEVVAGNLRLEKRDTSHESIADFINYRDVDVCIHFNEFFADISKIYIWGDICDASEHQYTESAPYIYDVSADNPPGVNDRSRNIGHFKLTAGDGQKTVHARLEEYSGLTLDTNTITTTLDMTPPTITNVHINKEFISKQSGYNTATLTFTANASIAGILASNGVTIDVLKNGQNVGFLTFTESGNDYTAEINANSISADDNAVNNYTFKITVKDKAGNTTIQNSSILYVDTSAPSVTCTEPTDTWYKEKANAHLDLSDLGAGLSNVRAWVNNIDTDTNYPSEAQVLAIDSTSMTIASTSIYGTIVQGLNYYHFRVVDNVGNAITVHQALKYDNIKPVISSVTTNSAYSNINGTLNISASDTGTAGSTPTGSGITQMRINGPINEDTGEAWIAYTSSFSFTLTGDDGLKTITVWVQDAAGNISDSKSITCELDRTIPVPTMQVIETYAGTTHAKPIVSSIATFELIIDYNEAEDEITNGTPAHEYKIWGDFGEGETPVAEGISESAAQWKPFVSDSNSHSMTVTGLVCTVGAGEKNIYMRLRDNAGNELASSNSYPVSHKFNYDSTELTAEILNIDHQTISCTHTKRRVTATTLSTDWCDWCTFDVHPSREIQQLKICAYNTRNDATSGTHNDPAITQDYSSDNMNPIGLQSKADIHCRITGKDLYKALSGNTDFESHSKDGTRWIVAYVQDLSGQWSASEPSSIVE